LVSVLLVLVRLDFDAFLVIGPVPQVARPLDGLLELVTARIIAIAVKDPFPLLNSESFYPPDVLLVILFVKALVMLLVEEMVLVNMAKDVNALMKL